MILPQARGEETIQVTQLAWGSIIVLSCLLDSTGTILSYSAEHQRELWERRLHKPYFSVLML